jgi:hypothetical protein
MGKGFLLYRSNALPPPPPPPNELNQKFEFKHVTGAGGSMNFSKWGSTIEFDFQRGREGVLHYFWF